MNDETATATIPTIHLSCHQTIQVIAAAASLSSDDDSFPSRESDDCDDDKNHLILRVPVAAIESVKENTACPTAVPVLSLSSTTKTTARNRAALLSATVMKNGTNDKLGLGLAKQTGASLIISSIKPGGLFFHSPFRMGDKLISINNVSCHDMPLTKAAALLGSITGTLTIVATNETPGADLLLVETMVQKPHPDSKIGLGISSTGYSRARVSSIHPQGIFVNSLLSRKDLILSINDVPCQYLDSKEVADVIAGARDYVTVVAERKHESAVVMAMAA